MRVVEKRLEDLRPYKNNPRKNEAAVDKVAASIKEFGFKVPLVITQDGEIVAGHTRLKAAEQLGMKKVPCIIADDLTPEQIKAFRLADNKTAEYAEWDAEILEMELSAIGELDMEAFGFDTEMLSGLSGDEWFDKRKKININEIDEDDEEYQEFIEKFKAKKTTDDCFTPENIYNAVAEWVANEYNVNRKNFVRPFRPNGDYQKERYTDSMIVVDNPPFSILSEIEKWYNEKGVRYFLFAPSVSCLAAGRRCCAVCVGVSVTYENGATVATSFVTNMDDAAVVTAPELYKAINKVNRENTKGREIPKYEYPVNVVTAARMSYLSKYGQKIRIEQIDASEKIGMLDAQRKSGNGIFGGGILISEKAAAEKAAAEKWELSQRELAIIKSLG